MLNKILFGKIHADYLTMGEAVNRIVAMAKRKNGGFIVTPNVDHIVLSESNLELQSAYADAALSLADGKPLIWMSKILGYPLPEKISGSDLVRPLLEQVAKSALRVYFIGSAPGVGAKAAEILMREITQLKIVGVDSPPIGFEETVWTEKAVMDKMLAAKPDIVFFALGAPKQEIVMHKWYRSGVRQIMLGVGASLDFISGEVRRAPPWMSSAGLEWLFRLCQDPNRLVKRYLFRDMRIISIFVKMLKKSRMELIIKG